MTKLYRAGRFIADSWHRFESEATTPAANVPHNAIIPLAKWRDLTAGATSRQIIPSVALAAQDVVDSDFALLMRAPLIVITLPKFTDGRAYSLARRLRETYRYAGELRAAGDVLLDQLVLLERCGFDSFEITDKATVRALERSQPPRLITAYQSTVHGSVSLRPTLSRERDVINHEQPRQGV